MEYKKTYVNVQARFDVEKGILPLIVEWPDGTRYEINRVLDICRAASTKVGGAGLRYRVRIVWETPDGEGRKADTFLYLEEDKWFVEEKQI